MRALLLLLAAGCGVQPAPDNLKSGGEFAVPGFDKRNYLLHLPAAYTGDPLPLLLVLHGGGGHNDGANKITCPKGDEGDPGCLNARADKAGFAVVYPDGNPGEFLEEERTWNAGGGSGGYQCVSGKACADGVDDLGYFDALHKELLRALAVDEDRVFVTGISNGGAMAHRLACERSTRFAAIAPIAAGNQVAAVQGCATARAVPVLEIHGTQDPCWSFDQSSAACAQKDDLLKVGVNETVAGWVERNGCIGDVVTEALGPQTTREAHTGCFDGADVVLLKSEGGGHTWPGGYQYAAADTVGAVATDYDADVEMLAFFQAHPKPAP